MLTMGYPKQVGLRFRGWSERPLCVLTKGTFFGFFDGQFPIVELKLYAMNKVH